MSQVTIQCRLVAPEEARQALWAIAAKKNTPLINELIQQVVRHSDFETWRQKGRHPARVVSGICSQLKGDARYSGQPARFFMSAEKVVNYIFKSWFQIQLRLQQQLSGKQKWLEILKSDEELTEICGQDLEKIREKAAQILKQIQQSTEFGEPTQNQASASRNLIRQRLFKQQNSAQQSLNRCAIAYLLKNGCQIPTNPEDPQKFALRRRKTEIQIKKLQDQIEARIPQGRDLTGQVWLQTLLTATQTVPSNNQEQKRWQDRLLVGSNPIPFPILFETNEDLVWSLNDKGRICVHFNGFSEHTFQIYCDQRQLPWFKRFLEDQEIKRRSKNQHTSALFALRSAQLGWKEGNDNGCSWNKNHLTLYCTVDTRLWSAEGTEEVRREKAADVAKTLTALNEKKSLSETQAAYAKRLSSTLSKLNNPFIRPSQPRKTVNAHIVVGLSLGWDKPLTLAVWDSNTQEILAYRSLRQLLGKDYDLFVRHRQQQQFQAHERHKAQRQGKNNRFGTSNLGEYIDRLLAKAVIAIAQHYSAGSIAVPKLDNIRSLLQAEIDTRAEQKIPGYIEGQKRYAKQYRRNIHRWSYARLIAQISSKAAQAGIAIEESKQPNIGSPQEKAKQVAIAAYALRKY